MVTRASGSNGMLLGTGFYFTSADTELYKNTASVSRMYFNNDEIRFQKAASGTAGTAISWSESMRIDSSGNVGIGTTSPSAKINIANSTNQNGGTIENSNASFNQTGLLVNNTSSTSGELFRLRSSGSNKLTVTGAGEVRINKSIHLGSDSAVVSPQDYHMLIESPAGSTTQLGMYVYGSSFFSIKSDGTTANIGWGSGSDREVNFQNTGVGNISVGIGTGAPGTTLHVVGPSSEILRLATASATANPYISFYQSTTRRSFIQHQDSGDMLKLASEYGGIEFFTGTGGTETEKMVIQSDGDVGIGVTNPVNKLQVGGKIYSSGDIQAAGQLQGSDLRLDESSSSTSDITTPTGFIDITVNGENYIIPYFTPE